MSEDNRNIVVDLPQDLCASLDVLRQEQGLSRSEFVSEVLKQHVEEQRRKKWERIFEYGHRRARELGISREDVPRLIEEFRAENPELYR